MAHPFEIIVERPAQHLRIRQPNACHTNAVNHTDQIGVGSLFHGCHQILVGLFAKALHRNNRLTMAVQMKDIGIAVDEPSCNKLLQGCLGKAVNV